MVKLCFFSGFKRGYNIINNNYDNVLSNKCTWVKTRSNITKYLLKLFNYFMLFPN